MRVLALKHYSRANTPNGATLAEATEVVTAVAAVVVAMEAVAEAEERFDLTMVEVAMAMAGASKQVERIDTHV